MQLDYVANFSAHLSNNIHKNQTPSRITFTHIFLINIAVYMYVAIGINSYFKIVRPLLQITAKLFAPFPI